MEIAPENSLAYKFSEFAINISFPASAVCQLFEQKEARQNSSTLGIATCSFQKGERIAFPPYRDLFTERNNQM